MFCFFHYLGAAVLTGCKNDDETVKKEEEHGINLAYMDTTVSPKQDFFRYVNGKWLDSTEIPSDRTTWGSFMELRQRTDNDALAILEKASESDSLQQGSDQAKAVYLYNTIMDTVTRNKEGVEPVKPYLDKVAAISNKEDLQKYLEDMEQYGGGGFFAFAVQADAKNSNMNAGYVYPGQLGLPDRDYYVKDDADSKEKRQKYVEHITRMLQYLGDSEDEASKAAKNILAFETKLAEPRLDKVERRDARKTYNPMTVAELQKTVPAIDWNEYFSAIGAKDIDTVIVSQPKYMKSLQNVLKENSVQDWKNYLRWTVFNSAAGMLSTDIEKSKLGILQQNPSGSTGTTPS